VSPFAKRQASFLFYEYAFSNLLARLLLRLALCGGLQAPQILASRIHLRPLQLQRLHLHLWLPLILSRLPLLSVRRQLL
jgi:hypothetical protein